MNFKEIPVQASGPVKEPIFDEDGYEIETPEEIFKEYCKNLMLKPNDFEGKMVMNVGSADDDLGEVSGAKMMVNLDIMFDLLDESTAEYKVVGRSSRPPFQENTFDLIMANNVLTMGPNKHWGNIVPLIRCLKSGGEIRFNTASKKITHLKGNEEDSIKTFLGDLEAFANHYGLEFRILNREYHPEKDSDDVVWDEMFVVSLKKNENFDNKDINWAFDK